MQPPYGMIWELLKAGHVVPFLGAGASLVGRKPDEKWAAAKSQFLPNGAELANYLAEISEFPSEDPWERNDLAKVCSYLADVTSRKALTRKLHELLQGPYPYGEIHRLLAEAPCPLLIVSTNYDTLLEQAFRDAGKPFDLIIYPADRPDFGNAMLSWPHGADPQFVRPNSLDVDLANTTVIFKMHGTVLQQDDKWDSFVISEDDYVDFVSRMDTAVPGVLMKHFRNRSFLFLGYGLRDWNLRVVLKNVSKHLVNHRKDDLQSWAIQLNPSELERTLWSSRNVKIFNVSLDEFVKKLRDRAPHV